MALVTRGKCQYYYRSERDGNRVKRSYVASGPAAEFFACDDEIERLLRSVFGDRERTAWEDERHRFEAREQPFTRWFAQVEAVFRETMERSGFHRHARGTWRHRRMGTLATQDGFSDEEWLAIVRRARAGDATAVTDIKRNLDKNAHGPWREFMDIGWIADVETIENISGKDLYFREILTRGMLDLRQQLAAPNPSGLERLLAARVASCWLRAYRLERDVERRSDLNYKHREYFERWIDRAHRRLLTACKALATVRRLTVPDVEAVFLQVEASIARPQALDPPASRPALEAPAAKPRRPRRRKTEGKPRA